MDIRELAAKSFANTKLPSSQEESWRKIRIDRGHDFSSFSIAASKTKMEVENASQQGVQLLSFEEAMEHDYWKDILAKYWEKELQEASDYFALQNLAEWKQGLIIYITQSAKQSIVILHKLIQANALAHRILLHLDKNVEARVIERFENQKSKSNGAQAVYWNTTTSACIAPSSKLHYLSTRNYSSQDYHFQRFFSEQQEDTSVFVGLAHCGGKLGKGFITARLSGKNSEFRSVGIHAGSDHEFHDIEMLADHHCAHSKSSLLYKTILCERAHSVFDGKLIIPQGIGHIHSYQNNHNLLLSSQARAESMPRLLIHAKDVVCEHGATVGSLDVEALFYLLSRGLSQDKARYLIIRGFLQEVIAEFAAKWDSPSQEETSKETDLNTFLDDKLEMGHEDYHHIWQAFKAKLKL